MCVGWCVCVCLVVFFGGGGGVVFRDGVGGKEGVVRGRKQSKGVTAAFLLFAKKTKIEKY